MKAVSLKLPVELVAKSEEYADTLSISRTEYIRRAIEKLNREIGDGLRVDRIKKASLKVRKESMRINSEFAATEKDPDA